MLTQAGTQQYLWASQSKTILNYVNKLWSLISARVSSGTSGKVGEKWIAMIWCVQNDQLLIKSDIKSLQKYFMPRNNDFYFVW